MTPWLDISDDSAVGEARRMARGAGEAARLGTSICERVAIVATEMASNLHRHAIGGRMLVAGQPDGSLALVAADRGPGIANPDLMLRDGVSTGGTMGSGLGAIERLSDRFEISTARGQNTIILATFVPPDSQAAPDGFELAGFRIPAPGYTVCGDNYAWRVAGDELHVMLCDGLGHGAEAAHDAELLARRFEESSLSSAEDLMEELCAAGGLKRGAVVMACTLKRHGDDLVGVGVGNISGFTLSRSGLHRIASRDGMIGRRCVARPATYALADQASLVLHSDGIKTYRMDEKHASLFARSPLMIAATILHEGFKGRDDASVLVVRRRSEAVTA